MISRIWIEIKSYAAIFRFVALYTVLCIAPILAFATLGAIFTGHWSALPSILWHAVGWAFGVSTR